MKLLGHIICFAMFIVGCTFAMDKNYDPACFMLLMAIYLNPGT